MSTATEPIPEGLRRASEQFATADVHGVAPDLAHGVRSLVRAAWDGSMCSAILSGEVIPLALAIRRSTAELDAAAMAYMASVPAEILPSAPGFDAAKFARDVVAAFTNLKDLAFDGMRTVDYDNLQGALTKHEDAWRSGPRKNDLFVIQQFCARMVELSNSLRERTGNCIANDADARTRVASRSSPEEGGGGRARASYESSERIVGGSRWPACANGNPDWVRLFGASEDDDEDGPWLTPRMAARIHHVALVDGECLLDDLDLTSSVCWPRLPKVARPFFKNSAAWRLCFRDCYVRIALRLQKGLPPRPNCTGEEMALHNIFDRAPDADDGIEDEIDALPEYPNDDDFSMVRELAVEDEDVLELFEENDRGYDDPEDDEPSVDNSVLGPGSLASFMLGSGGEMMRAANMHPKEWFIAFRGERMKDHI